VGAEAGAPRALELLLGERPPALVDARGVAVDRW
jgi:hypothetical protein